MTGNLGSGAASGRCWFCDWGLAIADKVLDIGFFAGGSDPAVGFRPELLAVELCFNLGSEIFFAHVFRNREFGLSDVVINVGVSDVQGIAKDEFQLLLSCDLFADIIERHTLLGERIIERHALGAHLSLDIFNFFINIGWIDRHFGAGSFGRDKSLGDERVERVFTPLLFQLPDDGEAAHGLAVDGRRDEETAIAVGTPEDKGGDESEDEGPVADLAL